MKQKWLPEIVENVSVGVSVEVEKKILEEIAEIAYMYLSQLPKDLFVDSFEEEVNFLQRTGTDA